MYTYFDVYFIAREVEAKQKADLAMRNLQMELRTAMANIKQVQYTSLLFAKKSSTNRVSNCTKNVFKQIECK